MRYSNTVVVIIFFAVLEGIVRLIFSTTVENTAIYVFRLLAHRLDYRPSLSVSLSLSLSLSSPDYVLQQLVIETNRLLKISDIVSYSTPCENKNGSP